jgi:hypothetical protein
MGVDPWEKSMSSRSEPISDKPTQEAQSVVRLTVAGFKSIREEQSIELRPLTILAGANSAGKSSIMQPFLLLKQTLEASYDPGPLLLNGPNVRFTKAEQLLSRDESGQHVAAFRVRGEMAKDCCISLEFRKEKNAVGFIIEEMLVVAGARELRYKEGMPREEVCDLVPFPVCGGDIVRDRCFLRVGQVLMPCSDKPAAPPLEFSALSGFGHWLRHLVHLPALRGGPERTYPVTAVGGHFPGTFDNYVAGVLAKWQRDRNQTILEAVCQDLQRLGLSWTVSAEAVNDAEVEIRVGRLPRSVPGDSPDLVSIADVGFGVSQALPVVVALHAAEKGQAVYIEQPEVHLHPRAQVALATVLANAAKRGVQVIIETHSRTLLLALQTLVAKRELSTDAIILHWFTRDEDIGTTTVRSATLDDAGAFGDWPEDFGQVEMDLESSYLDAAEARLSGGRDG